MTVPELIQKLIRTPAKVRGKGEGSAVAGEKREKALLCIGIGATGQDLLDAWGLMLFYAFGEHAYHVGSSSLRKTGWRDVDVRLILDDKQFEALFGTQQPGRTNAFWQSMMVAFSLWGARVTGLPIDFQVQKRSRVTQEDWNKPRNPLGVFATHEASELPPWQHAEEQG